MEKLKKKLRTAVTGLSQYLMDSENDLMKQIIAELNKICDEEVEKGSAEYGVEPEPQKHVHFGSNLPTIIQELDETLNESTQNCSHDTSIRFRADVISCIEKLKLEAMALYALSNQMSVRGEQSNELESEIEVLRKENSALQREMSDIKMTSISVSNF